MRIEAETLGRLGYRLVDLKLDVDKLQGSFIMFSHQSEENVNISIR